MTRLHLLIPLLLSTLWLQQQQVFRLSTDAVLVDVSVLKNGKTVAGLTASDFELRDNDVVQQVQLLPFNALPLDVTLMLDMSGSVATIQDKLKAELSGVSTLLEPTDQIQVIGFGQRVGIVVPRQPASGTVVFDAKPFGGMTALNDALLLALAERTDRRYRRLIAIFTDGLDNASWLSSAGVAEVAKRSDALLMMILSGRPRVFDQPLNRPGYSGVEVLPEWMLYMLPNTSIDPYVAAASATGGDVLDRPSRGDLLDSFAALLKTIRSRYLLAYTAMNVPQAGWHTIKVTVPSKAVDVKAREGYVK